MIIRKELLQQLENLLIEKEMDLVKIKELKSKLLKEHIKGLKIDNYRRLSNLHGTCYSWR